MNESDILDRLGRTYLECASYRDSGTVLFSDDSTTESVAFETLFVRPNKLRFLWQSDRPSSNKPFALWYDGSQIFTMFNGTKPKQCDDLRLAVASATGTSAPRPRKSCHC